MDSKHIIQKKLKDYQRLKKQNIDINCITTDLYDRAISLYKDFSETQINSPLF